MKQANIKQIKSILDDGTVVIESTSREEMSQEEYEQMIRQTKHELKQQQETLEEAETELKPVRPIAKKGKKLAEDKKFLENLKTYAHIVKENRLEGTRDKALVAVKNLERKLKDLGEL